MLRAVKWVGVWGGCSGGGGSDGEWKGSGKARQDYGDDKVQGKADGIAVMSPSDVYQGASFMCDTDWYCITKCS